MPCKSSTGEKKKQAQITAEKTIQERTEETKNPQNKRHLYNVIKLRHKQCTNANGQIFHCTFH